MQPAIGGREKPSPAADPLDRA